MQGNQAKLPYLYNRWLTKNASEAEVKEFLSMLQTIDLEDNLAPLMKQAWKDMKEEEGLFTLDQKVSLANKILAGDPPDQLTQQPIRRIHFLKTTWVRYAAAIILIFGTAGYLWFGNAGTNSVNHKNSVNTASNIQPGTNRAILTLANGSTIMLDRAQGSIVKQSGLTVVNLQGKVKYEGVGAVTEYNTISTPRGGQYQIILPDGSKAWLNAASSIKFPTAFTGTVRQVEMTGEVYLEVIKDKTKSFVVKANGTEIQVLGTSFNVNAYTDEENIKTTLVEGNVKLLKGKAEAILQPGQQAIISRANQNPENLKSPEIVIQTADIQQALAWKNGFFNTKNASLPEVMRQLERWYDIQVKYEGAVPAIKFQGRLDRGVRLTSVINWLSELGIQSKLNDRTLTLIGK